MHADPVRYTIQVSHWESGDVELTVLDVADDNQSRHAVAYALRQAANSIEEEMETQRTQ